MAIADTIISMQTHTSNAYTMIGYGTDLTGINKNLENLSTSIFNAFLESLRNPDTLFTNLPKKSGSGSNITLNDTANAPMRIELGASELTQAILPSGYTQVEYIQNTQNSYINTNFKPNNNTKVEAIASINETTNSGKFLFATRNSARTDIFCGLIWTDNKVSGGYGTSGLFQSETVCSPNTIFNLTLDKYSLYYNGTLLTNFSNQTFTSENNLYLFTANTNGSPDTQVFRGKIYSCKIWDNGTLVRNYIPCYRNNDNVIGMYDLVNNQFYTNAGTGTFTKGNNAPTPNAPLDIHTISGSNKVVVSDGNGTSQEADIDLGNIEYCKIGNYEDKFIRTSGKNLFDKNIATYKNGYIKNDNGDEISQGGFGYLTSYIKVKPNTQYTISGVINTSSTNARIYYYDSSKTWISRSIGFDKDDMPYTFTTPATCYYIQFHYDTSVYNADTIMINEGTTALPYEPYGSNEWYIKKNIGKTQVSLGSQIFDVGEYKAVTFVPSPAKVSTTSNAYCSKAKIALVSSDRVENRFYANPANYVFIGSSTDTIETLKAKFNGSDFYYPLAIPTYTPITGTLANQLENVYKNMLSQAGQTNISQVNNDLAFELSVSAIENL